MWRQLIWNVIKTNLAASRIPMRGGRYFIADDSNNVICVTINTSYSIQMEYWCICFPKYWAGTEMDEFLSKTLSRFDFVVDKFWSPTRLSMLWILSLCLLGAYNSHRYQRTTTTTTTLWFCFCSCFDFVLISLSTHFDHSTPPCSVPISIKQSGLVFQGDVVKLITSRI